MSTFLKAHRFDRVPSLSNLSSSVSLFLPNAEAFFPVFPELLSESKVLVEPAEAFLPPANFDLLDINLPPHHRLPRHIFFSLSLPLVVKHPSHFLKLNSVGSPNQSICDSHSSLFVHTAAVRQAVEVGEVPMPMPKRYSSYFTPIRFEALSIWYTIINYSILLLHYY